MVFFDKLRQNFLHVRESWFLASLYLFCGCICVAFLAAIVPPFENSDEFNHLKRVDQILTGHLIAWKHGTPARSGGKVEVGIDQLDQIYGAMRFHAEVKVTPDMIRRGSMIRLGNRGYQDFSNTAIYSPLLYIPNVVGLGMARLIHVNLHHALIVSRAFGGVACVLLGALSIYLMPGVGATFLFVILSLPMTLSLFASISQDGLMICSATLAAALMARIGSLASSRPDTALRVLFVLVTLLTLGRPAYAPLIFIPFFFASRENWRSLLKYCLISLLIVGAWSLLVKFFVMIPMWEGRSSSGQVLFLLHHPFHAIRLVVSAFTSHQGMEGIAFWKEMIGVLGWIDVVLPAWFYDLTALVLIAVLVSGWRAGLDARSLLNSSFITLILAGSIFLIFLLEYITFTPVGADYVFGVQGRYFIPLLPFMVFLMPMREAPRIAWSARALALCWMLLSVDVTLYRVTARYYIP